MRCRSRILLAGLIALSPFSSGAGPRELPLRSGRVALTPGEGIDRSGERRVDSRVDSRVDPVYWIVEFERPLSTAERERAARLGIRPLVHLFGAACLCRVEPSSLTEERARDLRVRAATPWTPEHKIDPATRAGRVAPWAITDDGDIRLVVQLFPDAGAYRSELLLATWARRLEPLDADGRGGGGAAWAIEIPPEHVEALIAAPIVRSVEEGPLPFLPVTDRVRAAVGADELQQVDLSARPPLYRGLSGRGVHVAVSEWSSTDNPDFLDHSQTPPVTRFLNLNPNGAAHGTGVAGIIAGGGWGSDSPGGGGEPFQWRGVAPEAVLIAGPGYGTYRVDVSNHSYVQAYGVYNSSSERVDRDVRGGNGHLLMRPHVWAAANQGATVQYDNEEGYYSLYSPAKNPIVVGSVDALDAHLSPFSSLGPTFDGRIKPDVMGPGCRSAIPAEMDPTERVWIDIDHIRIRTAAGIVRQWEFAVDGDTEGWFDTEAYEIHDARVSGGLLSFRMPLGVQGYGFVERVDLVARDDHVIDLHYRIRQTSPELDAHGLLYWSVDGGDYVDGNLRYESIADGDFHSVSVPVGGWGRELGGAPGFGEIGLGGWQGKVVRLRIDPYVAPAVTMPSHLDVVYQHGCGTSMAAPAVTGIVALMLEEFALSHGTPLATDPPLSSTIKAILIQTAQDLVHETPYPGEGANPDTGAPVLYHEGPDFATGYGLVDGPAAVHLVRDAATHALIQESSLDANGIARYALTVAPSTPELRVTLAWDDIEANDALGDQTFPRLVNDLDLRLVDPDGRRRMPWRVDPPPQAPCDGAGLGCGDADPIDASDILPAYRGPDSRNNVEQVVVDDPAPGLWTVLVRGEGIAWAPQSFSLVSGTPLVERLPDFLVTPSDDGRIDVHPFTAPGETAASPTRVGQALGVDYGETAIGDFTGDGQLDFVAATNEDPSRLYLFRRTGRVSFEQRSAGILDADPKAAYWLDPARGNQPANAPDHGTGLIAADLDADGNTDLLECINSPYEPAPGVTVYFIDRGNARLGDGAGGFRRVVSFRLEEEATPAPRPIFTGWTLSMTTTLEDVDGDGYPDFLAAEQSSGGLVSSRVYLFTGRGDGTFAAGRHVVTTDGLPATGMTLGDFQRDGHIDLLVGQDDDGDCGLVHLFAGRGDGSFDPAGVTAYDLLDDDAGINPNHAPGKLQGFDADGDGILDVVTACRVPPDGEPTLLLLRGRGDGVFDVDGSSVLATDLLHPWAHSAASTHAAEVEMDGDLDGDRRITIEDLKMVRRHVANVVDPRLRDAAFDIDGSGVVDLLDGEAIRFLATRPDPPQGAIAPIASSIEAGRTGPEFRIQLSRPGVRFAVELATDAKLFDEATHGAERRVGNFFNSYWGTFSPEEDPIAEPRRAPVSSTPFSWAIPLTFLAEAIEPGAPRSLYFRLLVFGTDPGATYRTFEDASWFQAPSIQVTMNVPGARIYPAHPRYALGQLAPKFYIEVTDPDLLWAVELTTQTSLFSLETPRRSVSFFSSYWGGHVEPAAGVTPLVDPLVDPAGETTFIYSVPVDLWQILRAPGISSAGHRLPERLFYRLIVFDPVLERAFATLDADDHEDAPWVEVGIPPTSTVDSFEPGSPTAVPPEPATLDVLVRDDDGLDNIELRIARNAVVTIEGNEPGHWPTWEPVPFPSGTKDFVRLQAERAEVGKSSWVLFSPVDERGDHGLYSYLILDPCDDPFSRRDHPPIENVLHFFNAGLEKLTIEVNSHEIVLDHLGAQERIDVDISAWLKPGDNDLSVRGEPCPGRKGAGDGGPTGLLEWGSTMPEQPSLFPDARFRRGDANSDGGVDISDPITTLGYLFLGSDAPSCADAADTNDDGSVDISDAITTLSYLFSGGADVPLPGAEFCGADPTSDDLVCESYPDCR